MKCSHRSKISKGKKTDFGGTWKKPSGNRIGHGSIKNSTAAPRMDSRRRAASRRFPGRCPRKTLAKPHPNSHRKKDCGSELTCAGCRAGACPILRSRRSRGGAARESERRKTRREGEARRRGACLVLRAGGGGYICVNSWDREVLARKDWEWRVVIRRGQRGQRQGSVRASFRCAVCIKRNEKKR
jgi:hypothetical protein